MKKVIQRLVTIALAQIINSCTFSLIMLPNRLAPTGLGGLATTINNITGINTQLMMIILALPLLIWAIVKFEKTQVFYAGFSYIVFTIYTGLASKYLPAFNTDTIVAAVLSGSLMGLGTGLVLRLGVSNGPEAIVGIYLQKTRDITPGNFLLVLNSLVILSSLAYGDVTLIIYSIICTFISSSITDKVIVGARRFFVVNIITEDIFGVSEYIKASLGRGVTFIQCMDTEQMKKKMLIKTVLTSRELTELKNYMREENYAKDSFVYAVESAALIGQGFD